ncbi:MAG TPA: hypothetical protein VHE30_09175 [Polyangiaceae bacterium]|nr:hypothetical protein [Polyangiaceae bacterium]
MNKNRLVGQLLVLVPTLAVSAWLGAKNYPVPERVGISVAVGVAMIAIVSYFQRPRTPS